MARTLNDQNLKDRAARGRLEARGKPHYRLIEEGLHLGYRKPKGRRGKPAGAGKWILRRYDGKQAYVVETIGVADDHSDADGVAILNFKQAQAAARERMVQRAHTAAGVAGPLTVEAAIEAPHQRFRSRIPSNGAGGAGNRLPLRRAVQAARCRLQPGQRHAGDSAI
jgi:hypothetical protein